MRIEKRSLVRFILLDILTFGIYGIVALHKMGNDIDALCKGDGRKPRFGYVVVWLMPLLGSIACFACGLVGYLFLLLSGLLAATGSAILLFFAMLITLLALAAFLCGCACLLGAYGYIKYWWYQQNNRLQLNAWRYGLTIREGGLSVLLWQSLGNISVVSVLLGLLVGLTTIISALSGILAAAISSLPGVLGKGLVNYSFNDEGSVFIIIVVLILGSFALTAASGIGKYISAAFMIKNLNRLADASAAGGERFEPMGYVYYNADQNYISSTANSADGSNSEEAVQENRPASVTCLRGALAGYTFELKPGEEIVIGKDAKLSNVVIDPSFKQVSRRHCGIRYDKANDNYRVIDYSSNGTLAYGRKLTPNVETTLSRGAEISLSDTQNIFRLD